MDIDRSATPPPINPPILDNDNGASDSDNDHGDFGWFYGSHAGGYVLNFGKHRGQKIHETSISYLYWCYRTFNHRHPLLSAFKIYHDGLEKYAAKKYAEFIVPFGWTHRGEKLRQCGRDKSWLIWTMEREGLTKKYAIFFTAAEHWLADPRNLNDDEEPPHSQSDSDLRGEEFGPAHEPHPLKMPSKKRSAESKRVFIDSDDDDDEVHGSEDYVDQGTEQQHETPKRATSSAETENRRKAPDLTPSQAGKEKISRGMKGKGKAEITHKQRSDGRTDRPSTPATARDVVSQIFIVKVSTRS